MFDAAQHFRHGERARQIKTNNENTDYLKNITEGDV